MLRWRHSIMCYLREMIQVTHILEFHDDETTFLKFK